MARAKTTAPKARKSTTKKLKGTPAGDDVFAAASARSERATPADGAAPKRSGTQLALPANYPPETHDLVRTFRELAIQIKSANAQKGAAEEDLLPIAVELLASAWSSTGTRPPGPVTIVNRDGQRVTLNLSDRTAGYRLSDEHLAQLAELLGASAIKPLLQEEDVYELSHDVLQEPGVKAAISKAIRTADLTTEQRARLLTHSRVTKFKGKCLEDLAKLAETPAKIVQVLTILRAAATRNLQA